MRGNSASKQLVLITILTIILILCVGTLIFLQMVEANKAVTAMSNIQISDISSSSQSEEAEPSEEHIDEIISSQESLEVSQSSESLSESAASSSCPATIIYYLPYVPPKPALQPTVKSLDFKEEGTYDDYQIADYGYVHSGLVTLKNKTFNKSLTILNTVGRGNILLENVIIVGDLYICGGDSITLSNVTAGQLILQNSNVCDVTLMGNTTISGFIAKSPVNLDEYELSSNYKGVEDMVIESGSYIWQNTSLSSTNLNTLFVNDIANITIGNDSNVGMLTAAKKIHLKGTGHVETLFVAADNVTYEKEPYNIKMNNYYEYPQYSTKNIGD